MESLSAEILSKIFRHASWDDRLLRLGLVDSRFRSLINFDDLRSINLSDLERRSRLQRERLDAVGDSRPKQYYENPLTVFWFRNVIENCLPHIGDRLEKFIFDCALVECGERHRRWSIDVDHLAAFVKACPRLRKIDFHRSTLDPDAYRFLSALASTLESLTINYVDDAVRLAPILKRLTLKKLRLIGAGVGRLDTADNNSIRLLQLSDPKMMTNEFLVHLLRFPNLEVHRKFLPRWHEGFVDDIARADFDLVNDNDVNRLSPDALIYSDFKKLKRSDLLRQSLRHGHSALVQLPLIGRYFPEIEAVAVFSQEKKCVKEAAKSIRRLKIMEINIPRDDRLDINDLESVLAVPTLRRLRYVCHESVSSIDIGENIGEKIACTNLRTIVDRGEFISTDCWSAILKKCPKLEKISSDAEHISKDLVDYAVRLGKKCRLQYLNTATEFAKEDFIKFAAQPLPRLRHLRLHFNERDFSFGSSLLGSDEPLIGLRKLISLDFDLSPNYEALEKILSNCNRLKKFKLPCVYSNLDGKSKRGHQEGTGLFRCIGRHSSLEYFYISIYDELEKAAAIDLGQALLDGRSDLIADGFLAPKLKINMERRFLENIQKSIVDALREKLIICFWELHE